MSRISLIATGALLAGCAIFTRAGLKPRFVFPFSIDSLRTTPIARGVTHTVVYSPKGPWAINIAEVELDRCVTAVAAKGGMGAAGRHKTTDILKELIQVQEVIGGVNADFFSLQTGVPLNALVMRGSVYTPPTKQPLFAIDSVGVPHIGLFTTPGFDSLVVDDARLASVRFAPFHPREAVGGRPRLTKDSAYVPEIETEGQPSFRARNPRTAIGIASNGKRLVLVVVDGRRKGYSDGMTLKELADLMLALGTPDALNLDGGGSSTMVLQKGTAKALQIMNMPSDSAGERSVGDALAIVNRCARS